MHTSFDPNNLLNWIALVTAITGLLAYYLAWKKFRLQYKKPKIDIFEISAKPRINNGCGGLLSDCFIHFYVINPSSFGNHISGTLKRYPFSHPIESKIYRRGFSRQSGDNVKLPSFEKILVSIYPRYEKVEKYKHRYLFLTIKDIRGKKTRKWFKFEDYSKKK